MEARLAKVRAKEKAQKEKYLKGDPSFKKRKVDVGKDGKDDDEEQFLLDDYESDGEKEGGKSNLNGVYSAATLALMDQLGIGKAFKEEELEDEDETKVFLESGLLDFTKSNRYFTVLGLTHSSHNLSTSFEGSTSHQPSRTTRTKKVRLKI